MANGWLADVHSHFGLSMRTNRLSLRQQLSKNRVSLVSWAVGTDGFLLQRRPSGQVITTRSAEPGEYFDHFQRLTRLVHSRLKQEGLLVLLAPVGVDRVLQGEIRIVLSTEGAYFLEGDPSRLNWAYKHGYRQIGLSHFADSDLADVRTEAPKLGGLSALGQAVIRQCNDLGMLVDLAHSTDQTVEQALDISKAPMLWSHSTIIPRRSNYLSGGREIMALSRATAQKLAAKGGVVGIWPSLVNYRSIADYGDGIRSLIDEVGEDHLAFGTDMDGLGPFTLFVDHYDDLRRTSDYLASRSVSEKTLEKISIGNYARLLRAVMDLASSEKP
jgi:membrane dipeptidase